MFKASLSATQQMRPALVTKNKETETHQEGKGAVSRIVLQAKAPAVKPHDLSSIPQDPHDGQN